MSIRHITLSATLLALSFQAPAITVESPGGLKQALGGDASTMTTLSVDGTIDASDLRFIATGMPSLSNLDLSAAKIAAYSGKQLDTGLSYSLADCLPDYALFGSTLSTVTLPRSLKSIGEGALASTSLTAVEVPASVTVMGGSVFNGCDKLVSVTVAAPLTQLPDRAFYNCTSLVSVSLPSTILTVGERAFAGCSSLAGIEFPVSVTSIGDEAFSHSGLTSVDLSGCRSLSTVGERAFADNKSLTEVKLPTRLKSIGRAAFFNDVALTSINIPDGVTAIPAYMLKGAAIPTIELGDEVSEIGPYAMTGMSQVSQMHVPAAMTFIGDNAFEGWSSLNAIDATHVSEVPTLGENVWAGIDCSKVNLSVPKNLEQSFRTTPQWQDFIILMSGLNTDMPAIDAMSPIRVTIEGQTLVVKAPDMIDAVSVFDMKGLMIATVSGLDETEAAIDVEAVPAGILLVKIVMSDSEQISAKVVKR